MKYASHFFDGKEFEKVSLILHSVGYAPPEPDTPAGGGYGANLMNQYRDLTLREKEAILAWGVHARMDGVREDTALRMALAFYVDVATYEGWLDREPR